MLHVGQVRHERGVVPAVHSEDADCAIYLRSRPRVREDLKRWVSVAFDLFDTERGAVADN